MRLIKYLLWIIPLLGVMVILGLMVSTSNAKDTDGRYHAGLPKSVSVRSNNFQNREDIPAEFSCYGVGGSPHIRWQRVPLARSYALIVMDWDAPSPRLPLFPVVHWVVYNIPRTMMEIPEKVKKPDLDKLKVSVGLNVGGEAEFAPPCPPLGQHQYIFRVYALDTDKLQPETNDRDGVMKLMEGHILTYGELVGVFGS